MQSKAGAMKILPRAANCIDIEFGNGTCLRVYDHLSHDGGVVVQSVSDGGNSPGQPITGISTSPYDLKIKFKH